MSDKSSVSLLQEYCAKNHLPSPNYIILTEESGFVCRVELQENNAIGKGRSKRNAKHESAHNLLVKLRIIGSGDFPAIVDPVAPTPQPLEHDADALSACTTDLVKELRDKCVRNEIPLPEFAIIQQAGTPDAPKFVCRCKVSTITRYGVSDKKKDARQQAAKRLLDIINSITNVSEQHLNAMVASSMATDADYHTMWNELEEKRRHVVKTYYELSELTNTTPTESNSVKFSDLHNYFTRFHDNIKKAALQLIHSDERCDEIKVKELLKILHITPIINEMDPVPDTDNKGALLPGARTDKMLYIELNVEIDCAFFGYREEIYKDILDYFDTMLV